MTSAQDRIQNLGLKEKRVASFGLFRSLQLKLILPQMKQNKATAKESQTNPPPRRTKKKKNLTRNPSTHLPQILPAKGALAGNQLWTTDKNGGQAPLSWEAKADPRTQTLSGLIGISHFSWEENNTRCPLDPKRSPTDQLYVKSQ